MADNVLPEILKVDIVSPLEVTDRGGVGIPVYLQDQTTDMLDLLLLETKSTGLLLGADTVIDVRGVELAPGHGLTTANSFGHIMSVESTANSEFYQGKILSIAGDIVTLSPPMSSVFTVANTLVGTGNPNMAGDTATGAPIDGSVTPVIFRVKPTPTQSGDITRLLLATTSANDSDLTTFGGAPPLSVGITLRVKRPDGSYNNLYTYQDNFDIAIHGFDTAAFNPKAGNAISGFIARVTFAGQSKHGVAVRLDGSLDEELQVVIAELMNNTAAGNLSVSFVAEGSELQGD